MLNKNMYIELKEGLLKKITGKSIKKAGSIRKLAKRLKMKRNTIFDYSHENIIASKININKMNEFIGKTIKESEIIKRWPDNWRQIKGGKKVVKLKIKKGILNKELAKARANIPFGKSAKAWHQRMKKEQPEEYHRIQYERFKKIGNYKYKSKKGEKVRNLLEKETADFLFNKKISYQYEPLVMSNGKYFFPDFLLDNNIIIECTAWRGSDKAIKLKEKIKNLEEKYKVYVLIPKKLRSYYKCIKNNLIFDMTCLEVIRKNTPNSNI